MIINFNGLTIQEAQLVLSGLKKLPMEMVEGLHNKLLASANEQFIAQQPQAEEEEKKEND
jgi:hypothetical protein